MGQIQFCALHSRLTYFVAIVVLKWVLTVVECRSIESNTRPKNFFNKIFTLCRNFFKINQNYFRLRIAFYHLKSHALISQKNVFEVVDFSIHAIRRKICFTIWSKRSGTRYCIVELTQFSSILTHFDHCLLEFRLCF